MVIAEVTTTIVTDTMDVFRRSVLDTKKKILKKKTGKYIKKI